MARFGVVTARRGAARHRRDRHRSLSLSLSPYLERDVCVVLQTLS